MATAKAGILKKTHAEDLGKVKKVVKIDRKRHSVVSGSSGSPTEFSPIRANPESRVISPYPPHIHFGSILLARVQYIVVHFGVTGITRMTSISKRPPPCPSSIVYRHPQTNLPPPNLE
ncbi:hypothetical protein EVAR_14731_1 [Eumeta japonica]|uniref:Uncharacterized protein n=1 Tax=Eumeta variegata TaxID=151549 RepID=A0A4C1TWC8_EUMVA|nr:hypothetical protein EVAR_14731_1 [Eumeta japonica]